MKHYFTTTAEQAHELTKLSKKDGFYFKTLSRTDKGIPVSCEVTERGYDYINANGIEVEWETTYDVVFQSDTDSNSKGFHSSIEDCKKYIEVNNGSPSDYSYFSDYKGWMVQIVCNETGEVVYECEVR